MERTSMAGLLSITNRQCFRGWWASHETDAVGRTHPPIESSRAAGLAAGEMKAQSPVPQTPAHCSGAGPGPWIDRQAQSAPAADRRKARTSKAPPVHGCGTAAPGTAPQTRDATVRRDSPPPIGEKRAIPGGSRGYRALQNNPANIPIQKCVHCLESCPRAFQMIFIQLTFTSLD